MRLLLFLLVAAAFLPVVFLAFARPDAALRVVTVARLRVLLLAVLFFAALFLGAAFFLAVAFLPDDFLLLAEPLGGGGTFWPFSLASDKPMAIACLRLVTFLPLRPLRSFPFFFFVKGLTYSVP